MLTEAFRGEFYQKVDSKARVSIPAAFRRILEAEDPQAIEGARHRVYMVYGGKSRTFVECYSRAGADALALHGMTGWLRVPLPPRTAAEQMARALRQLLQMRSGLRHSEAIDPPYESDEVRMLFLDGRDDMAGWAEAQPLEHEPGQKFEYSTPGATLLADVVARVLAPDGSSAERRLAVDAFLHDRLAGPLGMNSLVAEYDRSGTMIGGAMMWANARDWAKFGEFLRHGGAVKGAQIVPRAWVDFMKSASPRARDYGAMLWLNRASRTDRTMLFPDDGPSTLFAAVGHGGQYVLVSPSQQLVVARLGNTTDEQRDALESKLSDLVQLYPAD